MLPIAFIRSLSLYIANFILSLTTIICILIVLPFSQRKLPFKLAQWWGRHSARQACFYCGIRYQVIGQENIPPEPVVFMSKHESAWETTTLAGIVPPSCFVVKSALLKIPVYGWGVRALQYIPIDRNANIKAFKKVINEGKERIAKGLSIIIFPEGGRVRSGEHPKFLKSGSSLAKATGCKIVPIALNSGHCWQRNAFIKKPGLIQVIIGKPIDTANKTTDQINIMAYDWIKATMTTLNQSTEPTKPT